MKRIVTCVLVCMTLVVTLTHAETGVSRTVFTSAIENKEPVSDLQKIFTDTTRVYFFTELNGLNGHTIFHRWEYNKQILAEVSFAVGADRWRTWSSKNMIPSWTGTWIVSVLDEGGNIIEQNSFEYVVPELSKPEETRPVEISEDNSVKP